MKRYLFLVFIMLSISSTWKAAAQLSKAVIDSAAFDQWSSLVGAGDISADGKYVSYVLRDGKKEINVIKKITGDWQRELLSINSFNFLANNKQAIYRSKDTIYFIELGSDKINVISGVQSSELLSGHNNEWLLYQLKADHENTDLHILNTQTKKNVVINNVSDHYFFENSANLLIVQSKKKDEKVISNTLYWYDLMNNRSTAAFVLNGAMPSLVTSKTADQFCYPLEDTSGHCNALLFYKKGMAAPVTLVNNQSVQQMDSSMALVDWSNGTPVFMKDGQHICFPVKAKHTEVPTTHPSKVTIWRYNEELLPTEQRMGKRGIRSRNQFQWSVSVTTTQLVSLENNEWKLMSDPAEARNYLICEKSNFDGNTFWEKKARGVASVISVNDGKKIVVEDQPGYICNYSMSPDERYFIYYVPLLKEYFCFDTHSGQKRKLTTGWNTAWTTKIDAYSSCFTCGIGVAGWTPHDQAVLIYADYDIWKFDLIGAQPPVNITNGLGERNHIRFRIAKEMNQSKERLVIADNQNLLLYAFDSATKKSGFYTKRMSGKADPLLLNMDNYAYTQHGNDDLTLQKAKNTNRWIIRRENASFSPNLFYTIDFKEFTALSNIHPEKNYNWLTSELIRWKLPDGQYSQGILYKPDNFDSIKKYPVIFEYYEERSDELNQFIEPRYSIDRINIPYFVSHGYLVFIPDIHYQIANVGESALNSVLSAAKHLSKYSWIDSAKMGLQGHSFGGGETNYIVAHSAFFAAACEAAGPADAISSYGGLHGSGPGLYSFSRNELFEISQERMRASLAEIPEAYIKASPVLNAADVTTPLLMMHNQNDPFVPWAQGVEFFTGLKRMGKRVWMLEYEGGGHSINGAKAKDYTIRMLQFFDHYLKGAPIPKWMLEDGGLSYDLDITAPEPEPKEVLYKGAYQKVNRINTN